MITFKFEPHEQALMEEFRFIARELLRPFAAEADRTGELPLEFVRRPETLMLMRAFVPEEFGGGWQSLVNPNKLYGIEHMATMRVIACEEGGYGDPALFISLPGPGLAYPALRAQGSPAQQKRFFEPFLGTTPKWAAFAMTEPKAGSDVAAISTTARKEKDYYVINGVKWFIGNAARSDWVIVFATVGQAQGQFGVRPFLVERGTPGFRVGRILPTMGMRALQLAELLFEDCRVSEDNLLGRDRSLIKGAGFQAGRQTFNQVRPGIAAVAVGIARSSVDLVEEVVNQNGAFWIGAETWRRLRNKVDVMKRKLEGAKLLCVEAAWLADRGKDNTREASMAKALAAKVSMEVCTDSMEVAARAGLDDLSPLERSFRNAKVFNILEGTGEIQRLTISRSLIRG